MATGVVYDDAWDMRAAEGLQKGSIKTGFVLAIQEMAQ
jgi:hypothetical protein